MSRRIGPTKAAGTALIEREAGRTIENSLLGTTMHFGVYEKGVPGEVAEAIGAGTHARQRGTYIDGSEAPNAAFDALRFGNGATRLFSVRVTDGNERAASRQLYCRRLPVHEYVSRHRGGISLPQRALVISAKSGGRWAGRRAATQGTVATVATDITETTIATGETMLEDEWEGATLTLAGNPGTVYQVLGNTTAGVVTVAPGSQMATDLANGASPTNDVYTLVLDREVRDFNAVGSAAGAARAVLVEVTNSEIVGNDLFGLNVYVDEVLVKAYANLSLNPSSAYHIDKVIPPDVENYDISYSVDFVGSYADADNLPGWRESITAYSGGVASFRPVYTDVLTSANEDVGFIDVSDDADLTGLPEAIWVIEFTGTTTFKVYTQANSPYVCLEGVLATGTVGTEYVPSGPCPSFTVRAGAEAFTTGDKLLLQVRPLDTDVASGVSDVISGFVRPNASSKVKYGFDLTQVQSDRVASRVPFVSVPNVSAKIRAQSTAVDISDAALTFPITSETLELEYVSDADGYVDISISSATYANITEVLTALNGAQTGASRNPFFVEGTTGHIAINPALYTRSDQVGREAFIHVRSTSANLEGTETWVLGEDGDTMEIVTPIELYGGYDGATPGDADFLRWMDPATSPLRTLRGRGLGLCKVACPGVTATAVQKAGAELANALNHQYRYEVPSNITTESAAEAYINDTLGRNNYAVWAWPSYAYVVNPTGSGEILQTLTGAIHGREARVAVDNDGYHKAAAGIEVTLPHVQRSILGDRDIDEELLNPAGGQIIKKMKGNFIIWGDRTASLDSSWKWKHQREQMSHYEHVLSESFDWLIFMINDAQSDALIIPVLSSYFQPEWQKRALRGRTFGEAAQFKVDSENNTDLTRAAGDKHAEIALRLADTVERFVISVGKAGIYTQAA